ncbi:helix-turn-helix domain-containing protein [Rubrobacter marinus]|uniref:Helix-turn-helix domain-containing protein n=1 Tax=Rubrobacter marinus TaxID=2653852 RepID=A0A6G8PZ22_9ACTN|nr:Crp/Fnr family transcriptional regulator [Rubrobacter marinus]QIN79428.1 helix-turn-helix domain-containing protein [Rubrobacter marinus]
MLKHDTGSFAADSAPVGFGIEDFEKAGIRVVERRFRARDTIFTPGDPDDQLYFVLQGTIRLYKIYGDYKEATTALLKDRGVFGKLSLVEGRWQDVFAEAVSDVRVATVQKATITEVMKRRPDFAVKLFSSFSERLRQSDEVIESLLHREVSTRLATLLLNLGERFGEQNGVGTQLDMRLTHQDLANMIASTREAVSKVMSELQREGSIKVENRKIVLVDKDALAEHAGPSGLSVDGQLSI